MAATKKSFDCVEMKDQLQEEFRKRYQDLDDKKLRAQISSELNTSENPLALFWKKIQKHTTNSSAA